MLPPGGRNIPPITEKTNPLRRNLLALRQRFCCYGHRHVTMTLFGHISRFIPES